MSDFLTPLIRGLPRSVPFVGPETLERQSGQAFVARLGANESEFGPSPLALAAMQAAAADVWKYGDPENHALKQALAQKHGVSPAHIVVGEGIDGLFGWLMRLICAPGDRIVTSAGAYPTFGFHVTALGGLLTRVPYNGDHEDPKALVQAVHDEGAKAVYLANPDNPMGSWHKGAVIEEMRAALPESCLLVLDEAYVDLAPDEAVPRIDPEDPGVIRFRTFSKAYGMAGARIGYAIAAPALAQAFDLVRNHFGVSRIAQAGALASLADSGHLARVRALVQQGRERLGQIARANGLVPLASATNFVAIDCGADDRFARAVLLSLQAERIFVRMPGVAPLNRCIRISVGPEPAMQALAEALPVALERARGGQG